MKTLYFIFIGLVLTLTSCKKANDATPVASANYYVTLMIDQVAYVLDNQYPAPSILNMPLSNTSSGRVYISAKGKAPLYIVLDSYQALSGKPETIPIVACRFAKDQFEEYESDASKGTPGTITITKVDNDIAEGTFAVNVYSKNNKNTKLSITDGRFKLRFVN